jgi:Exostosin family
VRAGDFGVSFLPKPARILKAVYPDEKLLEKLKAVHLTEANIPEREFLQFRRLQSLIYQLRVAGYDIEAMQTEAFVGAVLFTYVNCKVAVTSCEYDFEVSADVVNKIAQRLPKDLIWVTTNANVVHNQIKALPIGMTDYCGYSPYHAIIGDTEKFKQHSDDHPRTEKNLVLMNFNERTNFTVRRNVRSLFQGKGFVTIDSYTPDHTGYARYVQGLRSHPFCLAPRGNGIDTHRIWESLYAGCIPIVQKVVALRDFNDLPILFIDRWEQACDEARLIGIRDEYHQRTWDLRKLTLSYWYQYVCNLCRVSG